MVARGNRSGSTIWAQVGPFLTGGDTIAAETLPRFWTMVAHYHGQVWNAAEFGRSIGTSENTARQYIDILAGAYMVRVLPPWFENLKKRQVKAPKIYIRDSGICHSLLQIPSYESLTGHPKIGASWEGFALEHAIAAFRTRDAYFWATHAGAELDLMIPVGGKRYGFEFKYADAPGSSRSMRIALHDLGLSHLYVIYPGEQAYPTILLKTTRWLPIGSFRAYGRLSSPLPGNPKWVAPARVHGTRELVVSNKPFIVPFRIVESEVQILRVLHGARKWPDAFK